MTAYLFRLSSHGNFGGVVTIFILHDQRPEIWQRLVTDKDARLRATVLNVETPLLTDELSRVSLNSVVSKSETPDLFEVFAVYSLGDGHRMTLVEKMEAHEIAPSPGAFRFHTNEWFTKQRQLRVPEI